MIKLFLLLLDVLSLSAMVCVVFVINLAISAPTLRQHVPGLVICFFAIALGYYFRGKEQS